MEEYFCGRCGGIKYNIYPSHVRPKWQYRDTKKGCTHIWSAVVHLPKFRYSDAKPRIGDKYGNLR